MKSKISTAIFGLIIIFFFLPFINIRCSGQKIITLTGIQLVAGRNIESPSPRMYGESQTRKIKGEPLAIFAFLSAIVGLGLSLLKDKKSLITSIISGIAGIIFLLSLKIKLDNDILKAGKGMLQLEYLGGYWLSFLLFLFVVGWNIYLLSQKEEFKEEIPTYKFCTECGAKNELDNEFCKECGSRLS